MRYTMILLVCVLSWVVGCNLHFPWQKEHRYEVEVFRVLIPFEGLESLRSENARRFIEFYDGCPVQSSAKFYNLGNAHVLAGELSEAIIAYHRGLRLDPNDSGMRDNLDYVRAKVPYPFGKRGRPEVDSWPPWLYRPAAFQVLVFALGAYSLSCILATRWCMARRRALLVRAIVVFLLAASCGFYWLHLENETDWQTQHPLVVIRDDKLPLRKGNGPSYPANPDLPVLARGMEARKMNERGGWLQIQFASGEVGWVEISAVVIDEP
jgi:hypothetical protein